MIINRVIEVVCSYIETIINDLHLLPRFDDSEMWFNQQYKLYVLLLYFHMPSRSPR